MSLFVRDRNFYSRFFSLTIAIALQNVIVYSVNLADNVMLGKFTEQALSGVALANQIQFLLQMLVLGISEGALIFASRSWGERDVPAIRRITNISLKCGLAVSGVMFLAALLIPQVILGMLSGDAAIVSEGVAYLRIICFSYPVFAVTQLLLYTLRSVETVKIGFFTSLMTLLINVCLNYVLIYGNLGAPRLGVRGAAIATLISRLAEMAVVMIYVFFVDKKIKLRPRHFGRIDRTLFRAFVRKGSPVFISNAIWGIAQAAQTAILGHTDGPAIAANSIAVTVFQIVSVFTYASASATSVVIGKTIGEGKAHLVKPYAKTMQMLFLGIGLCTGAVLFLLRDPIIGFYDVTPEAKEVARQFMTVLAVTVVGTSYQMPCHTGIVRAGGDTAFVLKVDLVFMWLIVIPFSAVAAFVLHAPAVVVFICLKCDQVLKCIIAVIKTNSFNYIKALRTGDPAEQKKG